MSPARTAPADGAVIEEVVALCRRLRLKYVRESAPEVMLTARAQRWDPAEALRVLLIAEVEGRDRSSIESRRRRAHFPAGKTFESWIESRSSISTPTQRALRSLEWVSRAENVVVAGPQGTGKSHLLEAIGHHAIDQGLSVAWFSVEDLGTIIRRHRVDDTVSKAFAALASVSLTVIDDIGLLPISRVTPTRLLPHRLRQGGPMGERLQIDGWEVAQAEVDRRRSGRDRELPDRCWLYRSSSSWTLVTMRRMERFDDDHDHPVAASATITTEVFSTLEEVSAHVGSTSYAGEWDKLLDAGHENDDEVYQAWVPERIRRDTHSCMPDPTFEAVAEATARLDPARRR